MNIIIRPNNTILEILGRQPRFKDKKYRLNKFCIIENVMNGKVIYNHLTFCMIFVTNNEYKEMFDVDKNTFLATSILTTPLFSLEKQKC